jgi:hypothetical protein
VAEVDQGQEATVVEEQLTVLREQRTRVAVLVQQHNKQTEATEEVVS